MKRITLNLQSINHSGSHIGRDITIKITSSNPDIDFEIKKNVLPDQTTTIDKVMLDDETDLDEYEVPLGITVIERDDLFSEQGSVFQRLHIDTSKTLSEYMIRVEVMERKLFFWKKTAKFDLKLVVQITDDIIIKRIPTVDNPEWTGDFNDDTKQMILARAIFGEAREGTMSDRARIAVGWSVRNRVEFPNPNRYGGTYHKVILNPSQYSSFSEGGDNNGNYEMVKNPYFSENAIEIKAWENCYKIAGDILNNKVSDPTGGADHFFDDSISLPSWAKPEYFLIKIDKFLFYDLP